MSKTISIIIPFYNEGANLLALLHELDLVTSKSPYSFEYVLVDDGSTDGSLEIVKGVQKKDSRIKVVPFTRNFGKEAATSAGLAQCIGNAAIILDCDLQHPPKHIPDFIKKWEGGADLIVGIRENSANEGMVKRLGSRLFYKIMNRISNTKMIPNSTDFRLLDRNVIDEFNKLGEHNRITRGLIDWLGFTPEFIHFNSPKRIDGRASYSVIKLFKLAFNSMVSLSLLPLRLAGYLGIVITLLSGLFGVFVFVEQYLLHDTMHLGFSGTAQLAIMLIFFVGIILISLGLIALYIENIYQDVAARPLYVVKKERSND